MYRTLQQTDFAAWMETLPEAEQGNVLAELRAIAAQLNCRIDRKPLLTHLTLDLQPNLTPQLRLN